MPKILLSVDVHYKDEAGYTDGSFTLTKQVHMAVAPDPKEELLVGEDQIILAVKRRRFDDSGEVRVELVPIQVNPGDHMYRLCDGSYRLAWFTDGDGDPISALTDAGFEVEAKR